MAEISGPWSEKQVQAYLRDVRIPVRLGVNLPSGYPAVVSLWYLPEDGGFWSAVHEDAKVLAWLRKDSRVAFEIAGEKPPYCGVRGRADVTLVKAEGGRVLQAVIDRYLGNDQSSLAQWLLSRIDEEWAIRVEPKAMFTWDYGDRMKGAHLEE